ncbi:hypothetical protein HOY80DRAFT_1078018 [Tuber brumale]|nr:hypothetical protein HOY80DRAFT_1078018 [Tuber brumale]
MRPRRTRTQHTIGRREVEMESVYMGGALQNRPRELPDLMKYYTYDLSQPRGPWTWKPAPILDAGESDTLTSSPSHSEYAYSTLARKGFYLWGVIGAYGLMNKDGLNATMVVTNPSRHVNAMVVFNPPAKVWENETVIAGLSDSQDAVMV